MSNPTKPSLSNSNSDADVAAPIGDEFPAVPDRTQIRTAVQRYRNEVAERVDWVRRVHVYLSGCGDDPWITSKARAFRRLYFVILYEPPTELTPTHIDRLEEALRYYAENHAETDYELVLKQTPPQL